MSSVHQLAGWCINSIISEPENWRITKYEAIHKNGLSIWIANKYYGISIELGGEKVGGVSGLSTFFGWAVPWRRHLYEAAMSLHPDGTPADRILERLQS